MTWRSPISNRLRDIVAELVTKPGHEKVRALVHGLLVSELGEKSADIQFERPLPEVRGRLDALLGCTVFEFKRDLRVEKKDAEEELTRYLRQREAETGDRFIGIATDGASFLPYELRAGRLVPLTPFQPSKEDPRDLLVWLDTAVSVRRDLPPDPVTVQKELGRESLVYERARSLLEALWEKAKDHPDVQVKRQLWENLLQRVYGTRIGADSLFLQHTYLTIVAKTMAARVLDIATDNATDLLSGRPFQDLGISGAVESDFFDWVLAAPGSDDLIARIARQVGRFRLRDIQNDVLKGLYESLIDPETRHDLGEYYTPDWLAARICGQAIADPLEARVLDPACGSGTFLFHAVRRFLQAAGAARMANKDALSRCADRVIGVDVHPVAVLIARVTYLLALGEELLRERPAALSIPVYLGDSLQWNTRQFFAEREVLIEVPKGPILHFPASAARDPMSFDRIIAAMLDFSEQSAEADAFAAWLSRERIAEGAEADALQETYWHLRELRENEQNHIWGYVARNLIRPLWLSSREQQADVIVGNPPWLSYRYMSPETQAQFKKDCQDRGIWAGGKVATHQDLSGYFFARSVELYLKDGGLIVFVMPYAAMTRAQFRGFRTGHFGTIQVRFQEAWTFDEGVQPLFRVPSCVLFAGREGAGPLPSRVLAAEGELPRRDAAPEEAEKALAWRKASWPTGAALKGGSPYRKAFRQRATMVPRRLCVVERVEAGKLGANPAVPLVQSRERNLEKRPWRDLRPLHGPVEKQFLRPLYLGESIAPYRLLAPVLCVVPWDKASSRLLDAASAKAEGYPRLARWMAEAERLWDENKRSQMTLIERWDYHGELTAQLPPAPVRVLYAASGTLPAAVVLRDHNAVAEHKLYWAAPENVDEARYLVAVLNSETARKRIAHLQSRGQWGARDFDKVMFEQPIPRFDPKVSLHKDLAEAAKEAEKAAAAAPLKEGMHFVRARRVIRDALKESGVADRIDQLAARLLPR